MAALCTAHPWSCRLHSILACSPRCGNAFGRRKSLPPNIRPLRTERPCTCSSGSTTYCRGRRHAGRLLPYQGPSAWSYHPRAIQRRKVHDRCRVFRAYHERRGLHPLHSFRLGTRLLQRPVDGTIQPHIRRSRPRVAQPYHGLLWRQQLHGQRPASRTDDTRCLPESRHQPRHRLFAIRL